MSVLRRGYVFYWDKAAGDEAACQKEEMRKGQ